MKTLFVLRYLNVCPDLFSHVGKRLDKKIRINLKICRRWGSETSSRLLLSFKKTLYEIKGNDQDLSFNVIWWCLASCASLRYTIQQCTIYSWIISFFACHKRTDTAYIALKGLKISLNNSNRAWLPSLKAIHQCTSSFYSCVGKCTSSFFFLCGQNGVLKNFAKFTGKHLRWTLFLTELQVLSVFMWILRNF